MNFIIKPSNKVEGTIKISGSKNASLPIIAACLLTKERIVLKNVPLIYDVVNMIRLLKNLGVYTKYNYFKNELTIHAKRVKNNLTSKTVKQLRASYYLMGAILNRHKKVVISYPGGCNLGNRPIDLHLLAFHNFQIKCDIKDELIKLNYKHLKSPIFEFPKISVGATINAIFIAVKAKGLTILSNIAIEPEVIDVINFLKAINANISFLDERTIAIKGGTSLGKAEYTIMYDRIEAGSYLLLASAIPNSKITINNIETSSLVNVINILKEIGNNIIVEKDQVILTSPDYLNSVTVETGPYPAFPTDLQPLLTTVLLNAKSQSLIKETIYPLRINHIKELVKMSADISSENGNIYINPSILKPVKLESHDLRCGFAMIIAAVMSKNEITINHGEYILRGYEDIARKLDMIGIQIQKS